MDKELHVLESINLEEMMGSTQKDPVPRSFINDGEQDFLLGNPVEEKEEKINKKDNPELEDMEEMEVRDEFQEDLEDEGKSPESDSSNKDSSIVFPLAKVFQERGHLPSDLKEEEFSNVEDLLDTVESSMLSKAETKIIESLPETIKEIIVNFKDGVPLDFLIENRSRQIEVANITEEQLLEDVELQKQMIGWELSLKGMDNDAINEHIELLEKAGTLDEKAPKAKKYVEIALKKQDELVKKQAEEQRILFEKQVKENQLKLRELINKQKEILPGVAMTKRIADEIYTNITTPVTVENKTPISNIELLRRKDPLKFEMNMQILYKLGVLEGNWEKVFKSKDASATDALLKTLEGGNQLRSDVKPPKISTDSIDNFNSLQMALKQQKHKPKNN